MKRSVKEIKRLARANLMGNYRLTAWIYVITVSIPLLIQAPFNMLGIGNVGNLMDDLLYLAITVIITVVENALLLGQLNCHLWLARHKEVDTKDVFYCFNNHAEHFFHAIIIRTAIATICALPTQTALALFAGNRNSLTANHVITITILLALSVLLNFIALLLFDLSYYLILDFYDMPISFALKESVRLMKGNKLRLTKLYLSFIGMMLLASLSMGIGFIFVMPYLSQSLAVFYLDVIDEVEEWNPPAKEEVDCSDDFHTDSMNYDQGGIEI